VRQQLEAALTDLLDEPIEQTTPVSGGDINRAFRIRTPYRSVFVKVNSDAPPHMFERESDGLATLRAADTLRVPQVIGSGETATETFLVLEWIDSGSPRPSFATQFGESLAELHRHSSERFGLDRDNFIGSLPQSNTRTSSWLDFFRDQRLGAQLDIARRTGALPAQILHRADKLLERLDRRLPERSTPSLLHGDLWGGNYMIGSNGEPVLIDPAVYYGDREIEIAFTQLFGGFGSSFYEAYRASWPLPDGYPERRDLYNLYPLLVHANLFGGGYVSRVDAVVRRYM